MYRILSLIALLFVLTGCAVPSMLVPTIVPPTPVPTSFVFCLADVGPANDHGWSQAHHIAAEYVKAHMGASYLEVSSVNPVDKPGVTVPQIVNDFVSKGCKLVLITADDLKDGGLEAAAQHPDVPFVILSSDFAWKDGKSYKGLANVAGAMGRMETGKMIGGCAAALTTQTGKIGYLGPLINDETRRLASAAYLGAQYCWANYAKKDPTALKFKVTWIGYWFNIPGQTLDPTKVADDFYNNGYDVVFSGIDTTEAIVEAGKMNQACKKVWSVAYDYQYGCADAPAYCLGSPFFNWVPAYEKAIKMVQDGKWAAYWDWNGPDLGNLNDVETSSVGWEPGKGLSADASKQLDAFIADMKSGKVKPFQGPLNYQDGTVFLKNGETATDLQVWYLPQLLQGMEGSSK